MKKLEVPSAMRVAAQEDLLCLSSISRIIWIHPYPIRGRYRDSIDEADILSSRRLFRPCCEPISRTMASNNSGDQSVGIADEEARKESAHGKKHRLSSSDLRNSTLKETVGSDLNEPQIQRLRKKIKIIKPMSGKTRKLLFTWTLIAMQYAINVKHSPLRIIPGPETPPSRTATLPLSQM